MKIKSFVKDYDHAEKLHCRKPFAEQAICSASFSITSFDLSMALTNGSATNLCVSESGGSGSEELKKCPPLSPCSPVIREVVKEKSL